ncbi:hypothetical protein M9H77_19120 [Catharanthus roseus]|uniref:Uncharacterized protein n=1 Tax=Catharanthus roseus TaxID=4058 RepID=A0ACC0B9H9_CATRO|nr:hypothetical protein M9H77_19120 [Catharanthus roseus]
MPFWIQLGLQANGIYEFDLLEYLSSSELIFLSDQQLVQKFHSTTTKSRIAHSKIKTPKVSRYGGRNLTLQRDNQDHKIGNFLNLMSNCVDGPFKVVAKNSIISCRRNFGYVGLVKDAIDNVQSDISPPPLTSTPNEYDSVIIDEKQYHQFLRSLVQLYILVQTRVMVKEHEQLISSTSHDQGVKRKYNILFEDDLLNTLSDYQTSQKSREIDLILIYKNSIHIFIFFNLLHIFSILPPPLLSDNHHHRWNYVVLHRILKCSMSMIEILMIIHQIEKQKRRGFTIEKIDKIGPKGHIFTFLRVTSPEMNRRIRMWDYDASDIYGEMLSSSNTSQSLSVEQRETLRRLEQQAEEQGEKIAPQKE